MSHAVMREIRVRLRSEVRALQRELRGLDVEASVRHMNTEHARRRRLPDGMPAKRVFDCGYALVGREQALDVAARQDQRACPGSRQARHGCTLTAPPMAFQAEWPPFMYFASKPA